MAPLNIDLLISPLTCFSNGNTLFLHTGRAIFRWKMINCFRCWPIFRVKDYQSLESPVLVAAVLRWKPKVPMKHILDFLFLK